MESDMEGDWMSDLMWGVFSLGPTFPWNVTPRPITKDNFILGLSLIPLSHAVQDQPNGQNTANVL